MNKRELLYECDFLTIEYSAKGKYLLDTWSGYTARETYLKCVDIIIAFLIEKKINNLIVDITNHQALGPDSHVIAKMKINNFSRKYGASKIAFIFSPQVNPQACSSREVCQGFVTTAFFKSFEEAEKWITKPR